jgi:hypothetical protein
LDQRRAAFGIYTSDKKFLKFDADGNTKVTEALQATDKKDHLARMLRATCRRHDQSQLVQTAASFLFGSTMRVVAEPKAAMAPFAWCLLVHCSARSSYRTFQLLSFRNPRQKCKADATGEIACPLLN